MSSSSTKEKESRGKDLANYCQIPMASSESVASQRAMIFNLSGHRLHQGIYDFLSSKGYKTFVLFGTQGLYLERGSDVPSYEEQTYDFLVEFLETRNKANLLPHEAQGVPFILLPAYNGAVIRLVLAVSKLFGPPIVLDVGKVGHSNEFTVIGGFHTGNWERWWRKNGREMLYEMETRKSEASLVS